MADKKISALSNASVPLTGAELVPLVQSSTTLKATIDQILAPAAGKGIDYSANGGDVLKQYDEGTWTPNLGGNATYTTQVGTYTRVGRLVFFTGYIKVNVLGSGSPYLIVDLPFTAVNDVIGSSVYVSVWKNLATTPVYVSGYIYPNSKAIELQGITAGAASIGALSILTNSSEIYFAGSYHAA